MEALSFMKLWLSNSNGKPRREIRISDSAVETPTAFIDEELCEEEGDDSFIELEISLSDFSLKTPQEKQSFSVSKSKILPFVEIASKPGQKLRAFSFNKSKSVENNRSSSLNVRFRIEDYEKSTKTTSFRKTASVGRSLLKNDTVFENSASSSPVSSSSSSSSSSSKRFFSLIKPLYTKKQTIVNSFSTSPASSPKQRSTVLRRQLGKSRSASSAVVGVMSPEKRVDESLQVQQDGIQSAILHCKNSFHGSRESSLLSRSTSESSSSLEKLSTSSSEDSYLFSRIGSDSMSEKSIDSLTSIKEQREKISDMPEF